MSFFRGWNDYKLGFGRADGEYWLGKAGNGVSRGPPRAQAPLTGCPRPPGLQNLHLLTLKQKYELRVDLEDFENNTAAAKYAEFSISPNAVSAEEDGYTLYVAGFEDGGAGIPAAGLTRGRRARRQGWHCPLRAPPPLPPEPVGPPPPPRGSQLRPGPLRSRVRSLGAAP